VSRGRDAAVHCDGQARFDLAEGDRVTARRAPHTARFLHPAQHDYFAQRRREFEFASLRAMGTEPRQVTRVLLLEQGLMITFAILAGAGIGFGVLRLLMPYVGRSIGSAFPPPILVFDWPALAISLSAIIAASAIGLLAALRALLRSSVTSVLRGEAE